ncbi:PH domain-containing protein [Niabella sp. CJ426]|jgi:hypothetical protein|uniref:PH domain-containing protein n=1 Tax=Niabella sp. CJ426 TaxID=3393740 RepID=UPI003CFE7DE1
MSNPIRKFLNEDQDPKAIEKIVGKLGSLLMSGEIIEYIAVQKKPAVNLSPDAIALTTKRVIFCRFKNLGLSMELEDYVWKDVYDCHMKESILGAEFSVKTISGQVSKVDYLPKAQARRLYTVAQEQEEKQREFRRQQDLEDKRATAGNVNVTTAQPQSTYQQPVEDPVASLEKLKALLDRGLIEQSEYDAKKSEILGRL